MRIVGRLVSEVVGFAGLEVYTAFRIR